MVEEDHVIGFDAAAEQVEKLLIRGPEHLEVISIVGMLGLGKTTLSKMVYKVPYVDYEFPIRAFVHVSQDYDRKEVLLKILNSFSMIGDEVRNMGGGELETYLRHQLEGKQYLVVLDDVCEKSDWDKFKHVFPENNRRCRVLITTRNEEVARYANGTNPNCIYKLHFLTLEDSEELFRWKVFNQNSCHPALKYYERNIIEKCAGLPLAVVVVAGVLANHPKRIDWWRNVTSNFSSYMFRDATQIGKVMELMFKYLPTYLKPCFLYFGVFHEDVEIHVWKLVRLWTSEGFIQDAWSETEYMAEMYLEELVHRNLVMAGQWGSNGKLKTCRIRGLLGEFCKKKAAEENFFLEIKEDNPLFLPRELDEYRRLCIKHTNMFDYIPGETSGKRVRSFLACPQKDMAMGSEVFSHIPNAFKLLRVLEIQSLVSPHFPRDICGLFLLKYVAIHFTANTIPPALSNLWNLQTLIVNTTSPTLEIKADIWTLPYFRHLHTNSSTNFPRPCARTQRKAESPQLPRNVRTLCTISPESCRKEVFDCTPKLKKLGIYGSLSKLLERHSESSLFGYLRKLESLENLKLLNTDETFKLYSLPPAKSFPQQLQRLTLLNTQLDWSQMSTLGELENLEVLKLKEFAFQGTVWNPEKGGFKRLKHLYIGRTDLREWEASADHFPQLKSLTLSGCDKLLSFPQGLAGVPSLQLVVLHYTNRNVASSARKVQVLKLEQSKKAGKSNNFKLSVYPPGH
ncbi:OLC1v1004384C2 [Oldenlandia corymbosa var. corymbosa]|nr:OLC1v1004384C2 [Oldenlandia corymbosa var. corymbosa]